MLNNRLIVTLWAILLVTFQVVAPSNNKMASSSGPVRGVPGDGWADIVIGKPNFGGMSPDEVTASRVFNPGGVIVDRSVTPNRMYVYDGGNSRVLGLHVNATSGSSAELVLGQPGLNGYSGCNGDSNFQNYPQRATPSAATLCSMPEYQVSPREGGSYANMAVDASGNLYVPDFDNHRVLFYLSPFETDTIADDVWGQDDFSGNECNRGNGVTNPNASSLCLRSPYNEGFGGGVGLDSAGNMWVADNQNNRVIRFPYDPNTGRASHVADLVLGEPDLATNISARTMDKMWAPVAVRIDAAGSVYVADSLNNRILIFDAPLSNGMAASRTLGANLWSPSSIDFDLDGNIWVNDSTNNQLLRFTPAGVLDRVLFKDVPVYDGGCGSLTATNRDGPDFYFPGPGVTQNSANVCGSSGSIGIDSGGNVWVAAGNFLQDVRRYPAPFPAPQIGMAHSADVQLFQGYIPSQANAITAQGLADPTGIAVSGDQLIVSDGCHLMFWNDAPASLTNGKAADGVVMSPNFNTCLDSPVGMVKADDENRLWVIHANTISVYHLPLVGGDTPFYTLQPLAVAQNSLGWNSMYVTGIAVTGAADYLWVVDSDNNRAFRIAAPLTDPKVDVVLGQLDASGNQCNQGATDDPSATSLCYPGAIAMDPDGNVYVSDFSLELRGNRRLLEYDANLFLPASPAAPLFGVPASRVYGTGGNFTVRDCPDPDDPLCMPFDIAFKWTGQMAVGLNGYSNRHFPLIYQNPLTNLLPTDTLKDYYSMPTGMYYDTANNLYVTDQNRGRVLIYLADPNEPHKPTPTVTKTPTPSSTPTAAPTPIVTLDEFDTSSLDPAWEWYAPKAGAAYSLTAQPGSVRLSLPGSSTYEHWDGIDDAPQLRRTDFGNGDWAIETELTALNTAPDATYLGGLVVGFGRYDQLWFGMWVNNNLITERVVTSQGFGFYQVQTSLPLILRIEKSASQYTMRYRHNSSEAWSVLASASSPGVPQYIGLTLVASTTGNAPMQIDFSYFRLEQYSPAPTKTPTNTSTPTITKTPTPTTTKTSTATVTITPTPTITKTSTPTTTKTSIATVTITPTPTITKTPTSTTIATKTPAPVTIKLASIGAQDGWVLESSENSNVGGAINNAGANFNLGDDAVRRQYRGILSFSTGASLPNDAVITGVTLKIRQQAIVGGGNPVSTFQGFMFDVKNGFFGSVSTLQTGDFQAAANATYGPAAPAPVGGWYSFNLINAKAFINKLATNSGLTQIRLRFKLGDNNNAIANYLSLYSGNAPAASRPQLVITYYVP